MEGYVILVLLIIVTPIAAGIWLIARAIGARQSIDELRACLRSVELEVIRPKEGAKHAPTAAPVARKMPAQAAPAAADDLRWQSAAAPAQPAPPRIAPEEFTVSPAPPPIPVAAKAVSPPPPRPDIKLDR